MRAHRSVLMEVLGQLDGQMGRILLPRMEVSRSGDRSTVDFMTLHRNAAAKMYGIAGAYIALVALHTIWITHAYLATGHMPTWGIYSTIGVVALAWVGTKLVGRIDTTGHRN